MATLILTAAGSAIGGPIGGAIGAMAGQMIDSRLFAPKGRDGPRLTELAVQTSSYGAAIPQLFGTMRVAGTVIWSTDLIEHAAREGGGKGRGSTTRYTYSASFAVLLSARPVRSVGRIWADGTLLRGAAGDLKVPVKYRLHLGDEAQGPDPLIASAEGIGQAPACRGQAYVVFEAMPLEEFGNRIPSLTFEVEADAGPVACGTILDSVSAGAVDGREAVIPLGGYAAYGDTLRGMSDGLLSASGGWIAVTGDTLAVRVGDGTTVELADRGAGRGRPGTRSIAAADAAPITVRIQHHDPARDYQAGVQAARRVGAGRRELRLELPAAIDAGAAKTLVAAVLTRLDVARERRTLSLDWRAMQVAPGDRVRIVGEPGVWRVADWSLEAMVLTLELVRIARAPAAVATATPGRVVAAPDLPVGATVLHAFECPPIDDAILSAPRLTIAAAGTGAGWRNAALQLSLDGGARWSDLGMTRGRATLGHVATPLAPAPSTLVDRHHVVEVVLANPDMTLADADDDAIDRGANMTIVGDELLQFEQAERIGPALWRLSGLWRGRRGTEWAAGSAGVGSRFVLLEPGTTLDVPLPVAAIGGEVIVIATGVGDGDLPAQVAAAVTGDSIAPPTPVHLTTAARSDGTIDLRWVRRSRAGWRWVGRLDVPLVEESETYAVETAGLVIPTTEPILNLPSTPHVTVRQIGTVARSRAAHLLIDGAS